MTTLWLLVLIILTLGVGLLAVYALGVGRRVLAALTERPSDVMFTSSGASSGGPRIGQEAPPLKVGDHIGPMAYGARRLVLFAEAGCQPCAVLAADLTRKPLNSSDVELVAVLDDAHFAERFREQWTVIVDPSWGIAGAWEITGTPHVTLLDQQGRVTHNTVVNTRKEVQQLVGNGAPQ